MLRGVSIVIRQEDEEGGDLQRLTSTLLLNSRPKMRKTSSRFMPSLPVMASLRGTSLASLIWRAMTSSKKHSFVLCEMPWLMASLIMWSPLRRVIMSL